MPSLKPTLSAIGCPMTATPILQPGQLEPAAGAIAELYLPPAQLFAARARRFRQLAEGHSLAGYLLFLARLAEWQQNELDHHPDLPIPTPHLLAQCREHAMPPLAPAGWPRQPQWQEAARRATDAVNQQLPHKGRQALASLLAADSGWLEAQADALLRGRMTDLDLAVAPLIGAALQVQWTHLVRQLQPHQIGRPEHPALCPVCGSHPVAAVIRAGGTTAQGLRYLHCVLCGSEWHVVRATCSQCGSTKGIDYYGLEGGQAVRAEACSACRSYLKILQQQDAHADPVADDIASLALDLLMGEKNYATSGVNLLMILKKG